MFTIYYQKIKKEQTQLTNPISFDFVFYSNFPKVADSNQKKKKEKKNQ